LAGSTGCKNAGGFGGVLDNPKDWGGSPDSAGSDGVKPMPLSLEMPFREQVLPFLVQEIRLRQQVTAFLVP
jgi:hypothetical protein